MSRAALMNRVRELEQATETAPGQASAGKLPLIVEQEERDGAVAERLRARGYRVMTFDDFVNDAV